MQQNTAYQLEPASQAKLPPLLAEYLEYKRQYPESTIFIQVGDFFEAFFSDAVTVAKALNLTLTTRDKNSANPVPMCGVPLVAIDGYLERFVAQGFSAALVVQTGTAAPKGGFARALDRIITPAVKVMGKEGTDKIEPVLAAVVVWNGAVNGSASGNGPVIASSHVESGVVEILEGFELEGLRQQLQKVAAAELILPSELDGVTIDRRTGWVRAIENLLPGGGCKFRRPLRDSEVQREFSTIPGFANLSPAAKLAVRQLVSYVDETTVGRRLPFVKVQSNCGKNRMQIDAATRASLELIATERGGAVKGSLLGYLDRTATSAGFRLLKSWVVAPSTDLAEISSRHAAVEWLLQNHELRLALSEQLRFICDLDRVAARVDLGVVTPRELGALRGSFEAAAKIKAILVALEADSDLLDPLLVKTRELLPNSSQLAECLTRALSDSPPHTLSDGGIFAAGFNAELDLARQARIKGRSWIVELEQKERARTGIPSLKIKFTGASGYFFEVTKAHLAKVPPDFIRRQHAASSDRFVTEELKQLDSQVQGAEQRAINLEKQLFEDFRIELQAHTPEVRQLSETLALLDCLLSFAAVADSMALVKPELEESTVLSLDEAVHPILKRELGARFIPNSISLDFGNNRTILLTGPNMGGKSTYLRQTALTVIMAQIGSFVPAGRAKIGIVDQIFARIGAADDIAEGDSTFMVEMREATQIVNSATQRSLVLIDEIGRGTATADGYALARAILEWLAVKVKCRCLFATHFHDLTDAAAEIEGVVNFCVGSTYVDQQVVFTHKIQRGAAKRSYGLEVARLAGLPAPLLVRANEIFNQRELEHVAASSKAERNIAGQLALFSEPVKSKALFADPVSPPTISMKNEEREALNQLKGLDINQMTPLAAFNTLVELQRQLNTKRDEKTG